MSTRWLRTLTTARSSRRGGAIVVKYNANARCSVSGHPAAAPVGAKTVLGVGCTSTPICT